MKKAILLALCAILFSARISSAHMFWVVSQESRAHLPRHVTTMIGYGHSLPFDDLLLAGEESIVVGDYFVDLPDGKRQLLATPATPTAASALRNGLSVQAGDLGLNKIILSDDAAQGTYQVAARIKDSFFTVYVDENGKRKMALQGMDAFPKAQKIVMAMRVSANGKTCFTVDKWTQPKPLGFELEIVPDSDLSNVRVGDLVRFKILRNGSPLSTGFKSIEYATAQSPSFGAPDRFALMSMLHEGMAQFRIPAAGQWIVNVNSMCPVDETSELAHLKGKAKMNFSMASLTFMAKP